MVLILISALYFYSNLLSEVVSPIVAHKAAELIMQYLESNSEINNSTARNICYIGSENTMKRIFRKLMDRNLIEMIPGRKGSSTAYRKIK